MNQDNYYEVVEKVVEILNTHLGDLNNTSPISWDTDSLGHSAAIKFKNKIMWFEEDCEHTVIDILRHIAQESYKVSSSFLMTGAIATYIAENLELTATSES